MKYLRILFSTASILAFLAIHAQCGPYKHHPVWPADIGYAWVNLNECNGTSSVLWDNGVTTELNNELSVGPHWVAVFNGSVPSDTLHFEIEQLEWNLNQNVFVMAGSIEVDIWAEVPYCSDQIFDGQACAVDADQTVVYLLQDGIAIDSITPVSCLSTYHMWTMLPFGYTYQTYVIDHSPCGSQGYGQLIAAYSCSGATLDLEALPALGGNNGSITVWDVIPDPLSSLPPPTPLTGVFRLMDTSFEQVGVEQFGTTAQWNGLAPGEYLVLFSADSLCDPVLRDVLVDGSTGIAMLETADPSILLWPVPTTDVLNWNNGPQKNVQVMDTQGRVVLEVKDATQLNVSTLSPGIYVLCQDGGQRMRFVKQ